jgi:hypothetical protein
MWTDSWLSERVEKYKLDQQQARAKELPELQNEVTPSEQCPDHLSSRSEFYGIILLCSNLHKKPENELRGYRDSQLKEPESEITITKKRELTVTERRDTITKMGEKLVNLAAERAMRKKRRASRTKQARVEAFPSGILQWFRRTFITTDARPRSYCHTRQCS